MPHLHLLLLLPVDENARCCGSVANSVRVDCVLLPLSCDRGCEAIDTPGFGEYADTRVTDIRLWAPSPKMTVRSSKEFVANIVFSELKMRDTLRKGFRILLIAIVDLRFAIWNVLYCIVLYRQ